MLEKASKNTQDLERLVNEAKDGAVQRAEEALKKMLESATIPDWKKGLSKQAAREAAIAAWQGGGYSVAEFENSERGVAEAIRVTVQC